jgi:hypothetical protein
MIKISRYFLYTGYYFSDKDNRKELINYIKKEKDQKILD